LIFGFLHFTFTFIATWHSPQHTAVCVSKRTCISLQGYAQMATICRK